MAHTPGPWVARTKFFTVCRRAENGSWDFIASVDHAPFDNETCLDNARLIAAAPELLEACIAVRYLMSAKRNDGTLWYEEERKQPWFVSMCKTINKAEGR